MPRSSPCWSDRASSVVGRAKALSPSGDGGEPAGLTSSTLPPTRRQARADRAALGSDGSGLFFDGYASVTDVPYKVSDHLGGSPRR